MDADETKKLQLEQSKFEQQLFTNNAQQLDQRQKEVKAAIEQFQQKNNAKDQQGDGTEKKRRRRKKKPSVEEEEKYIEPNFLYDTKLSHPIIEYLPSKEDAESATLTPSFVLEVTWPRIVQFYHPDSPHCQSLQSTYVALARGIRRRSSRLPVEFHAVNCGVYRAVCEHGFHVTGVPTFIGLRSGQIKGIEISLPGKLDDIASLTKEKRTKDMALKVEYVASVMNIVLDVVKGHAGAAFARSVGIDADTEDGSGAVIGNEFGGTDDHASTSGGGGGGGSIDISIPLAEQVFHDAKSSLLATLTSSLYSQRPRGAALPRDESTALAEFLDLIRWAFPPETQVHDLAEDLRLEYPAVVASEEGLLNVVGREKYTGMGVDWSRRCGAEAEGGYSCGLWTLLHILSVGVAERHTSVVGDSDIVTVKHAGEVMRSFIGNFFVGCDSCRKIFMELYDGACCGTDGGEEHLTGTAAGGDNDDWRSLAIWIWEVHNEITVRRKQLARTELWPSREDCPKCWQGMTDDTGRIEMNADAYDRDELYNHLKKTYWPSGVHNNRLVVLKKWSKAKRALSMRRLRARMAEHDWPLSAILFHLFVVYLVVRILCPQWSLRRAIYGRHVPKQKRKKRVTVKTPEEQRHHDNLAAKPQYSDKSSNWASSDYVMNKATSRSRSSRQPNNSGSHDGRRRHVGSSGSVISRVSSLNGGRRRHVGSSGS
eukprot:CAMPEP_0183712598 /NCGR_PEP_ID=MMETSP0737-20130205/7680_1 /TAXON_ID=385413 /ORGANISM="Thalassiosira miniscula, Strain CCMP1093" /LENGTH=708 /DNA_ID=CAMNT_0025941245 /DNA_START=110 /DNA_END=2232 /DNA_ORIENTATION=-